MDSKLKYFGIVIGVFAAIGVGLGLTGYVSMTWAQSVFTSSNQGQFANAIGQMMVGVILLQSIIVTLFVGPVMATVTGLLSGVSLDGAKQSAIFNGVASFAGFYVMVFIAVIVMSLALDGGSSTGTGSGGGFDVGNAIGPVVKAGIPTALVGGLAGYIGGNYLNLDVSVSSTRSPAAPPSDD